MPEKNRKRTLPGEPETQSRTAGLTALIAHVQERPWIYIGAAAFVAAVLLATGVYRAVQASSLKEDSTAYMRAIELETPAERAAALAPIGASNSALAPRALYLEGESALDAGDYEGARAAFEALRERFPQFEFVPDAVEGLGFIHEDSGDYANARKNYEEIVSKWPESSAAQRQPFNVARCLEGEGNPAAAIEQYRKQLETFPGSAIALRAQQRLNELRQSDPELFEDELPLEAVGPVLQELTTAPETAPAPDQLELSIDRADGEAESETPDPAPAESGPPAAPPE